MRYFSGFLIIQIILSVSLDYFAQDSLLIYYDIDEYSINQENSKILIEYLKKYNDSGNSFIIKGYTDYLGSIEYNKKLSLKRALAVKEFLINNSIKQSDIDTVAGLGEINPEENIYNQETGVPMNRKVEICNKLNISIIKDTLIKSIRFETDNLSTIDINSLEVGSNILLKNLNFQGGRHFLLSESYPVLEELLIFMTNNQSLTIEIQGHICCERIEYDGFDLDTGEKSLSVNRARYVYQYLKSNGIDTSRMVYNGYGGSVPLVRPELSDSDRTKNRRVEIKITGK